MGLSTNVMQSADMQYSMHIERQKFEIGTFKEGKIELIIK